MAFTSENAAEMNSRRKTHKGMPKYEPTQGTKTEEISEVINNTLYWFQMTKPETDDEVAQRLVNFFEKIASSGELPSVEKLALALGVTRQTLNDWEHGSKGERRKELILKAKEMLSSIDVELASKRKIDGTVWIFKSKNFYGYRDAVEYEITKTDPLGEQVDKKLLATKYAKALPINDD